jgi:hypothetical protein
VHRTQLYLDPEIYRALTVVAERENKTLSAVIRERLRRALKKDLRKNRDWAIDQAFGLWADRTDLPDTETYINRLRDDTERRKRLGLPIAKGRRR